VRSDNFMVALANLRANKVRSILSMLGIVIGTGAVILVTSIINGTRKATLETFTMGQEGLLTMRPRFSKASGRFGKIKLADVERIKRIKGVRTALPEIKLNKDVRGSESKSNASLVGVNEEYVKIYGYTLIDGAFITDEQEAARKRVCLINQNFSKTIFGFDYPMGKRIRVENVVLEVVGVVEEPENLTRMGKSADLLVPLSTLLMIAGDRFNPK